MGVAQLQARDLRAAESSLRKALALDQTLGGAHTALGVVIASTGRRAEAIEAWKRGAALGDANAADNLRAVR
jgi:Tfp pilus assembly protein PilF